MAPYTPPPVSKKARARDKELMASLGSRVESERRERLQSTVDDENWMRGAAACCKAMLMMRLNVLPVDYI